MEGVMSQRILIVDDDEALRESLALTLAAEAYEVVAAADGNAALRHAEVQPFDVVLCDLRMPGIDGLELLPQLARRLPGATIVLMSAYGTADLAIEAMKRGAYDYLAKPFAPSELLLTLRKARERERMRRTNQLLRRDVQRAIGDRPIVAASPGMIAVLELLERAAEFKSTVLLTGESGTGKEVLARAIHAQSPRRDEAFVAVNCAAIPEALLESELFGHVKGAFTGADRTRRGLFVEADGGTLFLDEIGELPVALQAKLLRVLQEEEVRPVGDAKSRKVDVRVIAATARELEQDVAAGRFREDLFYRLNVVRVKVPPLRERKQDIPLLADHFLARFREQLGRPVRTIDDDALERLLAYRWPGNARELENVIERAVILAEGERLTARELPEGVARASAGGAGAEADGAMPSDDSDLSLRRARRAMERDWIVRALRACQGNRTHAARRLQISHRALLYKLKEYGIRD
jgi:two-component system response regulator AtoC